MAAIDPQKLEQSRSKYFEMVAKDPKSSPFLRQKDDDEEINEAYMHLSHYSTAGTVQYYKIRQIPAYLIKLQNEALGGPPDRIFHDVNVSW